MFIGHFALGFAAKRLAPRQSLGVLIAAPILVDMLWPLLVLAGVERFSIRPGNTAFQPLYFDHFPWTHSLLMGIAWAVLFGLAVRRFTADAAGARVAGLLVLSHWVLDFISHRPDMPLFPGGGPKLGLGLWNSIPATVAVEVVMFAAGIALYARMTRARDRIGIAALWSLIAVLFLAYLSGTKGQAPPSQNAVILMGIIATPLSVAWAWWADRHREVIS